MGITLLNLIKENWGNNMIDVYEEEKKAMYEVYDEMLDALQSLVDELHKNRKLDVKKDFSLMVADTQARKVLHKYREAV